MAAITTRLVDTITTPTLLVQSKKIEPKLHTPFQVDQIVDAYETFSHAARTRALKVIIEV